MTDEDNPYEAPQTKPKEVTLSQLFDRQDCFIWGMSFGAALTNAVRALADYFLVY